MISKSPRRPVAAFLASTLVVFMTVGSTETVASAESTAYEQAIENWRKGRAERLTSEDGWLTVIGLLWLDEGVNTLGGSPSNDLVFATPKAPATIGTIRGLSPTQENPNRQRPGDDQPGDVVGSCGLYCRWQGAAAGCPGRTRSGTPLPDLR